MSNDPHRSEHNWRITNFMIEFALMHVARCPEIFEIAREHLQPEYLSLPGEIPHRVIWMGILDYHGRYETLPGYEALSAFVLSELEGLVESRTTVQEAVENADDIMSWMYDRGRNPDSELNPTVALEVLREILVDRTAVTRLRDAVRHSEFTALRFSEGIRVASREIERIEAACQRQSVSVLGDGLDDYYQRLDRYRGRQMIGLRSGLPVLDDRTCGLRGFMLLGAAPGVGKSVYSLQIAAGVCRHSVDGDNDACALYLSLDMDSDDMQDRLFCHLAGVDWKTYRLGSATLRGNPEGSRFTDAHQQRLDDARRKITEWQLDRRLAIVGRDEVRDLTASRITAMSRAVKEQSGAEHCLIVVDYLQLLPVPEEAAKQGDLEADKHRVRVVQQVLDASKDQHDRPRDAVIVISEARKPSTSTVRHSWGTKVEDLMGSARLGYAADAVLLMRPMDDRDVKQHYGEFADAEQIRQELDREGVSPLVIGLSKARDGMVRGSWPAEFHFEQSTITEGITARPETSAPSASVGGRRPGDSLRIGPVPESVDADLGLD